jgi:hypothetical protein
MGGSKICPSPFVQIGLTDLPKSGRGEVPPSNIPAEVVQAQCTVGIPLRIKVLYYLDRHVIG